ncbi:MAG: benzoate-CoA ligase family protein [Deltaproteobacteria bacterium]|nr:benzoate-CoA ligase family protein [Deltaproteobacteria bacterium]
MPDVKFPEQSNLCQYFLTSRIAAGRGAHPAVVTAAGAWTYAELEELAARCAGALGERGITPDQRVLFLLRDGIHFAAAFFGTLRLGAVVAMVNPDVKPEDVVHYVRYTGARAVVADHALTPVLQALPADLQHVVILTSGAPASSTFDRMEDALARAEPLATPAPVHADDPAIWLFTSGSTGLPRAVVHRAGDYIFNTEVFAKGTIGLRPDDVTVSVPKLFFGYATGTNLMFPLAVGATAALFPERSTPESVLAACARHRATVLTAVPTMMAAILAQADADPRVLDALRSLRFMFSAGEALPRELYERWKARTGVEVYDGIGSAEMFHIYISNRPGDVRPGTLGRIVDGYRARIVDDDGRDVPDGEIGTMHISGKSVGLCYWRDREKSYQVFRGDTCITADKFSRDGEGYYTFHGRADDLLKVGGRWVAPLEVENALLGHAAVDGCCVVGKADADGLDKPLAFVVLKAGHPPDDATADALKAHVKDRLQPYKYPRWVKFVDGLPKNDRGKVDRKAVRALV